MEEDDIKLIKKAINFFESSGYELTVHLDWEVYHCFVKEVHGKDIFFNYVSAVLSDNPEYCEKLTYLTEGYVPYLHHKKKKKDLVCRSGELKIHFDCNLSDVYCGKHEIKLKRNNLDYTVRCSDYIYLTSGERVTIDAGTYHALCPELSYDILHSDECETIYDTTYTCSILLSEISTYNDLDDIYLLDDREKLWISKYVSNWHHSEWIIKSR